ncbi:MAG: hypothetical protein IJD91_06705 [Clostridia bacterium]|nr:hypothetical protein [Clostridia bacterium]
MRKITAILLVLMFVFPFTSCGDEKTEPLQKIEKQELINKSTSSDNKYTIKAYRNNGGATVDWAVLCTLTDNETKNTKNIYWQYHEKEATIEWIDNDTVKINNITLNLPDDTYDWRNN